MAVDNGDGDEGGPLAAREAASLSRSLPLFRTISIFNNAGDKEQKAGPTQTPRLRRGGDEAGTPISSDDAE